MDSEKKVGCKHLGITLIEIPYFSWDYSYKGKEWSDSSIPQYQYEYSPILNLTVHSILRCQLMKLRLSFLLILIGLIEEIVKLRPDLEEQYQLSSLYIQ